MTDRFDVCLPLILAHEGGYVDHPRDPGGATNLGVTLGTLSDYLGRPASKAEVKALTPAKVAPIYRKNYWETSACGMLPDGVDYMVFDLAVNSGPGRAKRYLQGAVGAIEDQVIGPKTIHAANAQEPSVTIAKMAVRRENFYRNLDTFPTFGRGWLRRLSEVTAKAQEMAK